MGNAMSFIELGALGEFIGAIAVVVTLIYLAFQLRQNTEALRTSTIQSVERGISDLMSSWTASVENAALVQRGFTSYDELSDDEKAFIQYNLRRLLLHMDTMYWSYRRGLLPEEIWEREKSVLKFCVNSSGGREAWRQRTGFSEPFREFVDAELIEP